VSKKSLSDVLPVVRQLAERSEGFSNGDLAKSLNTNAKLAGYWLSACMAAGHIFMGKPEGKHGRYFDTAARAQAFQQGNEKPQFDNAASHEAVAQEAVVHLRNTTLGSSALAELCKVQPALLDAALAPLVDAGKLMRINAFRKGAAEFDYRWSATWMPKPEDFAVCRGGGTAPAPAISPVAPPTPGKLERGGPAAPTSARVTRPVLRDDHVSNGKSGGHSKAARDSLERAFNQKPQSLGWAPAPAPAAGETKPADSESNSANAETIPPARETKRAEPDAARIHINVQPVPLQIDVTDLVCALNSRGELALDLGDEVLIKFKPKHALVLTRFLAGTTVLEQMAQRGEL
jgi:hypothetical protein